MSPTTLIVDFRLRWSLDGTQGGVKTLLDVGARLANIPAFLQIFPNRYCQIEDDLSRLSGRPRQNGPDSQTGLTTGRGARQCGRFGIMVCTVGQGQDV